MTKRLRYDFLIEGEHTKNMVKQSNIFIMDVEPNLLIQLPDTVIENLFSQIVDTADLYHLYHFFLDLHQIDKQKILVNYSEKKAVILMLMQSELVLRRPDILQKSKEMKELRLLETNNWKKNFPSCINPGVMIEKNSILITNCTYFTLFTFIHSFIHSSTEITTTKEIDTK